MTNHETTNENGKAILTNLEAGEYNITILKDGFDTRNTTINVDEDHLEFNIVLNAHTSIIYYCEVLSGATSLGDATVQTTGKEYNGYYEISVTDADDNSLIGEKYWISSEAVIDGTTSNNLFEDFNGTSTNLSITMSTSPRTFVLGITVTDGENALQGVSVTVNDETHTTGSAGGCSFNLLNGDYEATFTKEGYITKTETITVNGNTNLEITLVEIEENIDDVPLEGNFTISMRYDSSVNREFNVSSIGSYWPLTEASGDSNYVYFDLPYSYIDYGDGSEKEELNTGNYISLSHEYEDDGIYDITIHGYYYPDPDSESNDLLGWTWEDEMWQPYEIDEQNTFNPLAGIQSFSFSENVRIGLDRYDYIFADVTDPIHFELYWTDPDMISEWSSSIWGSGNNIYTVPSGTRHLYIAKGFPMNNVVERDANPDLEYFAITFKIDADINPVVDAGSMFSYNVPRDNPDYPPLIVNYGDDYEVVYDSEYGGPRNVEIQHVYPENSGIHYITITGANNWNETDDEDDPYGIYYWEEFMWEVYGSGDEAYGPSGLVGCSFSEYAKIADDNNGYLFGGAPNLTDIQLYWKDYNYIRDYSTLLWSNVQGQTFTIPQGTTDLYIIKGYPSNMLIERDEGLESQEGDLTIIYNSNLVPTAADDTPIFGFLVDEDTFTYTDDINIDWGGNGSAENIGIRTIYRYLYDNPGIYTIKCHGNITGINLLGYDNGGANYNKGITDVIIPVTVTTIGNYCFRTYAENLKTIKFNSIIPPTAGPDSFADLPTTCIIYIPRGTLNTYTSAQNYPSSDTYTYVEYGVNNSNMTDTSKLQFVVDGTETVSFNGDNFYISNSGTVSIDWGDGTTDTYSPIPHDENATDYYYISDNSISHTYQTSGNYTITFNMTVIGTSTSIDLEDRGVKEVVIPDTLTLGCGGFMYCTFDKVTIGNTPYFITNEINSDWNNYNIKNLELYWTDGADIYTYGYPLSAIEYDEGTISIPYGTTSLYTAKNYPSNLLVERSQ